MNAAQARMILVVVRQVDEIEPARVLRGALGDEFPLFFLFMNEELRDRFGAPPSITTCDQAGCMLNAERFCALLCFAGPRDLGGNLLTLRCFREIGLATFEVQKTLLQEGFANPFAAGDDASNALRGPLLNGVPSGYTAEHLFAWSGPDGIGHPRAEPELPRMHFQRSDLIAVTSSLDWNVYDEKQRYQFAIAILRLARKHPELHFVWRARDLELQHGEGRQILSMVEDYRMDNLGVEKAEPLDAILSRCAAGVSMVGGALLDYEAWQKPVAVFACDATDELVPRLQARCFRSYYELERLLPSLRSEPAAFSINTGIQRLNARLLRDRVRSLTQHSALHPDWAVITLKYVAYVREGRAVRNDMIKLTGVIGSVERQMKALDKRVEELQPAFESVENDIRALSSELAETREWMPSIAESVGKVDERVGKVADRVSVLQRSTLAYKTRKLVSRFGR